MESPLLVSIEIPTLYQTFYNYNPTTLVLKGGKIRYRYI